MKKSIIAILLFISIFIITGCNKNTNEESNSNKKIVFRLNTEGLGQVSYYVDEENKVDFDDEYPSQSTYTTFEGTKTVSIDAKADEGWIFVKWMKDDKLYSKESKLDIEVSKDTELIAVFETKGE